MTYGGEPYGGLADSGTPAVTGTLTATLPAFTASLSGTTAAPITPVTGSVTATLPALTGSLSGSFTVAPVSAALAATLPALMGNLSGSVEGPPAVTGTLNATLTSFTGSLAGSVAAPVSTPPTVAGPPVVETVAAGSTSGNYSHDIANPTGIVAGDLLFMVGRVGNFTTVTLVNGSGNADGWTLIQTGTRNFWKWYVWVKIATGAEGTRTPTMSWEVDGSSALSSAGLMCARISGAVLPLQTTAALNGSTNYFSAPSMVTTGPDRLMLGVAMHGDNSTLQQWTSADTWPIPSVLRSTGGGSAPKLATNQIDSAGTFPSHTFVTSNTQFDPMGMTFAVAGPAPDGPAGEGTEAEPFILTGTGGSFTLPYPTQYGWVQYTPASSGSLVMSPDAPGGWLAEYTVYDVDGDEIQVDSDGELGLVWAADEVMLIRIGDGTGLSPETFTWSYADRASSVLSLSLEYDYLLETPSGFEVTVSGGLPGEVVTFSIVGGTSVPDFQTTTLDNFGIAPNFIVNLPGLAAGDYLLRIEGTASGSEEVEFATRDDALSLLEPGPKAEDTSPTRDPAQHWRFYDLRDPSTTWTFPRNPKSWSNVWPPNDFTHSKTTAPDGQALTYQAAARPWRMEFTGWLDTEEEYNALLFWSQLRRRFWLIDHRDRAWLMTIEGFDAQPQIKPNIPWAHTYTVKTLIFAAKD